MSRRVCLEGCVWRGVSGEVCLEGCVWRGVSGGGCLEGGVWRGVSVIEGRVCEVAITLRKFLLVIR